MAIANESILGYTKRWLYLDASDASILYCYEYLGNGELLTITPLTALINATATQAFFLKKGCAPIGPAGSSKTEITKDLAMTKARYALFRTNGL